MTLRILLFVCLSSCLALTLIPALCAADPVAAYFAARQAAPTLVSGAQVSDALAHPGSYAGRTLEAPAAVSGLVSAGGDQTALLLVGGASVAVPVSPGLRAPWLDSGARVQVLLLVAPDDPALPNAVRLVAVAPEGDIVAAEQARQRAQSAAAPRRLASRPGRRDGGRTVWVADASSQGRPAAPLSGRALAIYGPYRSLVRRWNRRLSDTDVDRITTSILYFSDRENVDPRLAVAMIIAESDFDLYSTSRTGAMGLGQLMPGTARGLGVTDAYDPVQNIGAAIHILRGHLDQYGGAPAGAGVIPVGQIALTMAAYNAGPGAVRKYKGVPPYRETRRYVARVAALYHQMCGLSEASARQ